MWYEKCHVIIYILRSDESILTEDEVRGKIMLLKSCDFFRRKHWGFGEFFQACFAAGSHKFDLYRQCTYLVFIRQAHVNNNSPILLKKKQKYMSFQSTSALWCCNFIPFVRRFVFIHWTNKAKNKSPPHFIEVPAPASNLSVNIYKYIYDRGI